MTGCVVFFLALAEEHLSKNREDLQLMTKVAGRDQTAFEQLYDRYAPVVYTMVLRIVKTPEIAEDLLQEIFLAIWNKSSLFSEARGSVYTWIMSLARHRSFDFLKSKDRISRGSGIDEETVLNLPDTSHLANPLNAAISSEHEDRMREGLALLGQEQRTIIELSYYEGYTQAQIAERLGLPLGTVKTWMRQGLMTLRTHLKEHLAS
jgi:RNA polymerase sigma-70 factor (ECF subfamily)